MNLEDFNYHNDPRNCDAVQEPTVFVTDENGNDILKPLPWKYEVCDVCDGKGTHVNPSIDCGGISREEFQEDPDFEEEYFSGSYDMPCNACDGKRVVPVVDRENCDPDLLAEYDEQLQDEADSNAERLAELRMRA